MKKIFTICCLFAASFSFSQTGNVGIGTTTPDSSAMLDVSAVNKGILIPRIASAARAGIASPATGLLVFQTDGTAGFYYYTGIIWVNLASGLTPNASGYANPSSYGLVSTFAGSSSQGSTDATGAAASFNRPTGVAVDGSGNVYVADQNNHKIRKITTAGVVTTLAGSGSQGSTDATGAAASFNRPTGVAVDGSGNVYVADQNNHKIRKITPAGLVTTLAGNGSPGSTDATIGAASFFSPTGIAVDGSGNVYVADLYNNKIRKVTPAGLVTTLAGSGTYGSTDGTGVAASFSNPFGVAVDAGANVYVADQNDNKIRKVTPAGVVTTLAGSGTYGSTDGTGVAASFSNPFGVAVDAGGNVYVADYYNQKIRKITPAGVVTTLAGSGSAGSTDASGTAASFNYPAGVAVDGSGNIYVADYNNNKIRKIITAVDYITNSSLSTALNSYATTASLSGYTTFENSRSIVHDSLTNYVSVSADQTISGVKTFSSNLIANGNVGIGTTAPVTKLTLNGGTSDAFTILNGGDTRIYDDAGTSSALFYATSPASIGANKAIFTLLSDGKTFNFNGTGGSVSSDARLKQDITPLNNSLQKILQLNGYSYRFKTKATDKHKEIGVLAQEVKKVLPEAVYTDDKGMYSVSYNSLVPLLINAVKELKQKLDKTKALQLENKTLKRNQQDLAKRMEQLEAIVMKQQTVKSSIAAK